MNILLISKGLLGVGVVLGGSATGAYFGTRVTIEDYFSKDPNNLKKIEEIGWQTAFDKLNGIPEETELESSFSSEFSDFKKNQPKSKTKEDLKRLCEKFYTSTYKSFGIEHIKTESDLFKNIKDYCFVQSSS